MKIESRDSNQHGSVFTLRLEQTGTYDRFHEFGQQMALLERGFGHIVRVNHGNGHCFFDHNITVRESFKRNYF